MSKKIFVVILIFAAGLFLGAGCAKKVEPQETTKSDRERAIEAARKLFKEKKAQGLDMSNGPCLSDEIIPDWVADVAHSPRQQVDNVPENQCLAFREGKAKHFVELDENGNLIRAK